MRSPGEDGYFEDEIPVMSRKEQNARSFLVFVGSVLTILLLGLFLYLPLDTFTRILALLGTGALWIVGFTLLDKRRASNLAKIATLRQQLLDEMGEEQKVDEYKDSEEDKAPLLEQEDNGEVEDELSPFERLVREALDSIPEEFQQQMENLVVMIEDEPDAATLEQVGAREGQTLLGLYHGVPLTDIDRRYVLLPERITIYQRTIERYCHNDPERVKEQVRATVLHEVAHHFGMDHDEMPIWVK